MPINNAEVKTTVAAEQKSQKKRKNYTAPFANNIVWFLLFLTIIVLGLIESTFFSISIMQNILVQTAVLGVLTAGMAHVLIIGEIDLSIIGTMAFSAGLGTYLMTNGLPWFLAVLVIVLFGIIVGAVNGFIITKLKAAALIETLAMGIILEGALMALTEGQSIVGFPEAYSWIGQGTILGLPALPIPFLILYGIVYFIWKKTSFGRSLFATGGNSAAAHVSGINIDNIKILAFIISGGLAGFAGYLLSAYMGAVTVTFGGSLLMYTLAAAVIGGVSLTGGVGKISGILGGVLLLTVIDIGLQMMGISSYLVTMAGGIMIFIAVVVDAVKNKYLLKI